MSTQCYPCVHGVKTIGGIAGTSPLGSCAICGVFACDAHARRDAGLQRFECVICVPSLLASSAVQASVTFDVGDLLEQVVPYPTTYLFHDLDDFFDRWPELRMIVDESPLRFQTPMTWRSGPQTEPIWYQLSEDGQNLWTAAVAVTVHLNIPTSLVPPLLRPFLDLDK